MLQCSSLFYLLLARDKKCPLIEFLSFKDVICILNDLCNINCYKIWMLYHLDRCNNVVNKSYQLAELVYLICISGCP